MRVAFVGSPADDRVPAPFQRVSAEEQADVYHIRHDRLAAVRNLRSLRPEAAIVVDLSTSQPLRLDPTSFGIVCSADVVAVGSDRQARTLEDESPRLVGRTAVVPRAIDLERFAPDEELAARRRVHYSRFKRYHRLAPPTVLFAGPYTPDGGLDVALEAIYLVREDVEDVRFTAIPFGPTVTRFLERCERRALLLGHRGIVEWNRPDEDELPFWFGAASIVLVSGREAEHPALFAAAAARPVIALGGADSVRASRAAAEPQALAAAIRELFGPAGGADGEARRQGLLEDQEASSDQRAQVWRSAAFAAGAVPAPARKVDRAQSTSAPSSSTVIHPR